MPKALVVIESPGLFIEVKKYLSKQTKWSHELKIFIQYSSHESNSDNGGPLE